MLTALITILAIAFTVQIPTEPGLYYSQNALIVRMEGRITVLPKSAKEAAELTTVGIRSIKVNGRIAGKTSEHVLSASTIFYYRFPPGSEALGGSAADLVLVKMKVNGTIRQFQMGTAGMGEMSSGISLRNQVDLRKKLLEPQVYEITTPHSLRAGEYGLYLFRGYDRPDAMYDFTVK
jgi:hypothetical protein